MLSMVMKARSILRLSGDDEVVQHNIYINKYGPQEIFPVETKYWVKYEHKKSYVLYYSQEAFNPGGK